MRPKSKLESNLKTRLENELESEYPIPSVKIMKYPLHLGHNCLKFEAPIGIKYLNISNDLRDIWVVESDEVNPFDLTQYKIYIFKDILLINESFFNQLEYIKMLIDKRGEAMHLFIDKKWK